MGARAQGFAVYEAQGQAHAKSIPFLPVLQMLRAYFEIGEGESDRAVRERIAGKLLLLDGEFAGDLPLLFDFLGVPDAERPAPMLNPEAASGNYWTWSSVWFVPRVRASQP